MRDQIIQMLKAAQTKKGTFAHIYWITKAGALRRDRFHIGAKVQNRWESGLSKLEEIQEAMSLVDLTDACDAYWRKRSPDTQIGLLVTVKAEWTEKNGTGDKKADSKAYDKAKRSNDESYTATLAKLTRREFVDLGRGRWFRKCMIMPSHLNLAIEKVRQNQDPKVRIENAGTYREYAVEGIRGLKLSSTGLLFTVHSKGGAHVGPRSSDPSYMNRETAANKFIESKAGISGYRSIPLETAGHLAAAGQATVNPDFVKLARQCIAADNKGDAKTAADLLAQLVGSGVQTGFRIPGFDL